MGLEIDAGVPALTRVGFDRFRVGELLGTARATVDAELASGLAGPIGERTETAAAPPGVFPVLFLRALRLALSGLPDGGILARFELDFGEPLAVGSEVEISIRVGDAYERRGRAYVVFAFEFRDAAGELAVAGRMVTVWPDGPGQG
ncbi:MAG: hypothetical protein R2725_05185 [Solirubrobacterales bacterium]